MDVYQFETGKHKDAVKMAKACAENNFHTVIAVGGDGTVNEVVNGIMQFEGLKPKLGILPNGTGNDFVAGNKMPLNLNEFIPALLNDTIEKVDVGQITTANMKAYFINIADIGFGGKVVQILDQQRKMFKNKSTYRLAILRTFLGYRKPVLHIKSNDFEHKGSVFMLAFCNGSIFGNGLTINPQAKINDGLLNLTLLGHVSIFHYLKNLKNLKKGNEIKHPEVKYLSAEKIEVKIIHGLACTEVDGEFVACTDVTIGVIPGIIDLLWY